MDPEEVPSAHSLCAGRRSIDPQEVPSAHPLYAGCRSMDPEDATTTTTASTTKVRSSSGSNSRCSSSWRHLQCNQYECARVCEARLDMQTSVFYANLFAFESAISPQLQGSN